MLPLLPFPILSFLYIHSCFPSPQFSHLPTSYVHFLLLCLKELYDHENGTDSVQISSSNSAEVPRNLYPSSVSLCCPAYALQPSCTSDLAEVTQLFFTCDPYQGSRVERIAYLKIAPPTIHIFFQLAYKRSCKFKAGMFM